MKKSMIIPIYISHVFFIVYSIKKFAVFSSGWIKSQIMEKINIIKKGIIVISCCSSCSSSITSFLINKYTLYQIRSQMSVIHSHSPTYWSNIKNNTKRIIQRRNIPSLYTIFFWIIIGATMALSHKINHKLKIFDPMTFPTDKFHCQLSADIADTANSGAEVPAATIVSQISIWDIFSVFAILIAEVIR